MDFSKLIYQLNDIRCQINDGEHGETQAEICDVIAELRKFEGMTCGEIIEALFPMDGINKENYVEVVFKGETHTTYFSRDFWDSPYKGVSK